MPQADEFNCLNLNISVPHLPSKTAEPPIPVMVFLHGGAFTYSMNSSPIYDGRMLAYISTALYQPTIIVTVNYRLGVYGFLASHDLKYLSKRNDDGPGTGNMGIWDQVLALRWVQQHIAAFGGDPLRVTLFGQSAGAASVHAHLLRGEALFSSAIMQSGLLDLCGVLSVDEYQVVYERLLLVLGIPLEIPAEERVRRLLGIETQKLTAAMVPTFITPVVTTPLCDDGVLLPGGMPRGLDCKDFHVPDWCPRIVMGDARNECIIWNKSWDNLSPNPIGLGQDLSTPTAELTLEKLEDLLGVRKAKLLASLYDIAPNSKSEDVFWALERMTTHGLFSAPIYFALGSAAKQAQLEAELPDSPSKSVYAYHFDVPSPYPNPWRNLAHHSNDNVLIWGVLRHTLPVIQQKVADRMAAAWIAFANGEDPWEPFADTERKWMVFGREGAVVEGQNEGHVDWGYWIWETLKEDGMIGDLMRLGEELCLRRSELVKRK